MPRSFIWRIKKESGGRGESHLAFCLERPERSVTPTHSRDQEEERYTGEEEEEEELGSPLPASVRCGGRRAPITERRAAIFSAPRATV